MADEFKRKLKARASVQGGIVTLLKDGGRRFQATLCSVGDNLNGQILTAEEARMACASFKDPFPIRMTEGKVEDPGDAHPTTAAEIIGKAIGLEFIPDATGGTVDFVGDVYDTTPFSKHAHQLIRDRFYSFDSMEVDYAEGECSACHARFRDPGDICAHLTLDTGGRPIGTNLGQIIMHGVKFTGVSMLDRHGADPKARVKAVANLAAAKEAKMAEPAKEKPDAGTAGAAGPKVENDTKDKEIQAKLDAALAKLEAAETQLAVFRKKEREARCAEVVTLMASRGRTFDDETRAKEITRLSDMSDDTLGAIETALKALPEPKAETTEAAGGTAPITATASIATPGDGNPRAAGDPAPGAAKTEADEVLAEYAAALKGD